MKQPGGRAAPKPKRAKPGGHRSVTAIDTHIGAQVRRLRLSLRMSQEQLAEKVGVTFQQIQKYEKGVNRISASTLFDIAQALDANVLDFMPSSPTGSGSELPPLPTDPRAYSLLNAFDKLQSRQSQRLILQLAQHLAQLEAEPDGADT